MRAPLDTGTGAGRGRLHDVLAAALLCVLALAPLPLGANRPQYWLFWSGIILALSGLYLLALAMRNHAPSVPARRMLPEMLMLAAFIIWGIAQTVPLFGPHNVPSIAQALIREKPMDRISLAWQASALAVLRWLAYAAFFALMMQCARNGARARRMGWAIFLIITAHAIWALIATRIGAATGAALPAEPGLPPQRGLSGPFANRNAMASFTGLGLVLGTTLWLNGMLRETGLGPGRRRARLQRLISGRGVLNVLILMALGLALMALLATASRMGVASSLLALWLAFALLLRKRGISLRIMAVMSAAGAALFLFSLPWTGPYLFERTLFSLPDGSRRFALYQQVLQMIGARPWLGYGLDAFPIAYEQVHRPPVSPDLVWARAHSTYLALWSEAGLAAGSLPLAIFALWIWRLARALRRRENDFALIVVALAGLFLAGLHSSLDFSFEMPANAYLLLAIMALGLGRSLQRNTGNPATAPKAMGTGPTKRVHAAREADRTPNDQSDPAPDAAVGEKARPGADAPAAPAEAAPGAPERANGQRKEHSGQKAPERSGMDDLAARFQATLQAHGAARKMDE